MEPVTDPAGILAWRHEKWAPVAKRKHTIHGVFQQVERPNEYMLHGDVVYKMKDGTSGAAQWGGWMTFDEKAETPKLKKYVVWLVSCRVWLGDNVLQWLTSALSLATNSDSCVIYGNVACFNAGRHTQ